MASSQPIRVFKRFYVLVLLSLMLGLVCSELPESFSLTDDTSNDFVEEFSPAMPERTEIAAPDDLIPQQDNALTEESIQTLGIVLSAEPALYTGPSLLRLLSIQRK